MSRSFEKSACSRCGVSSKWLKSPMQLSWDGEPFCARCAREVGLKASHQKQDFNRADQGQEELDKIAEMLGIKIKGGF